MDYWVQRIVKMFLIVFLLFGNFCFFSCTTKEKELTKLPYYNDPSFTPIFVKNKEEVSKKITHTISNFSFLNQDSIYISQNTVDNKIHVANFIFTSCGSICPTMTKNMKFLSDSLQNDPNVVFLSYSVTPWIDKPNVLKRFTDHYNIQNPNWHFLTGNTSDIYRLARTSYFAEEDIGYSKDSTEFLHTEHFILVDKQKKIRGIYNGTLLLEMHQLFADITSLKEE